MSKERLEFEMQHAQQMLAQLEAAQQAVQSALALARETARDVLQVCGIATLSPLTDTDMVAVSAASMRARELLSRLGYEDVENASEH